MSLLLTLVHIVVCFMLITVILLQAGRGQGLSGASFGGGNVQSLFGTRGSEFLQKATTAAAIIFMLTSLGLSLMEAQKSRSLLETGRQRAPIDVDQIKKALEEVKGEAEVSNPAAAGDVIDDAAEAVTGGDPVTSGEMAAKAEEAPEAAGEMAAKAGSAAAEAAGQVQEKAAGQS